MTALSIPLPQAGLRDWARLAARAMLIAVPLAVLLPLHLAWHFARIPSPWAMLFLRVVARVLGMKVRVFGERLRRDVFFAANHISWHDVPVLGGIIKVTCEEFWAPRLVLPALTELRDSNPEVQVEFDVTADSRDIAAGEADLALRSGPEPGDDCLIWRKLDDDPIGIYCAQSYPNPPTSLEQLGEHPFVGHTSHVQRVREAGADWSFHDIVNSWEAVLRFLSRGTSISVVPRAVARTSENLVHCFDLPVRSSHWLVYRPEDRRNAALKKLLSLVEARYRGLAPL